MTVRKLSVVTKPPTAFPDMWYEIFVVGDDFEQRAFAELFAQTACRKAKTIEEADIVVFTGGPDVNPDLYDEERHRTTHINLKRDEDDLRAFAVCWELGIPMFGVCRGAQFLHVMNGGKLYQNVNHHNGDHQMYDCKNKRLLQTVSSVHHQMVMKNEEGGMEIIGITYNKSTVRALTPTKDDVSQGHKDIEAFWYPNTGCFGVQGHPEYRGYDEYALWTMTMLRDLFDANGSFCYRDKKLRLKQDLLDARASAKIKGL